MVRVLDFGLLDQVENWKCSLFMFVLTKGKLNNIHLACSPATHQFALNGGKDNGNIVPLEPSQAQT